MPATPDDLFRALDALGIVTRTVEHAPVFTVEEARGMRGTILGAHTKNLFLRDNKRRFFLVTMEEETAVDLKALRPLLGAKGGLSFASPDYLLAHLGVQPGSVSPFAVINDTGSLVKVAIDATLLAAEAVNCHPLVNTRTTTIRPDDLVSFLRSTGHEPIALHMAASPAPLG